MNVSIPEEIGNQKRLRVLDLYGALDRRMPGSKKLLPLKPLPKAIEQLSSLEELNLGRNGLQSVPPQIAQLPKLKKLCLDYNEIHEIPLFIGNLKNLKELSIRSNGGMKLPGSLAGLKGLKILMGNNNLSLKDQKALVSQFPNSVFSFENEYDDESANEEGSN
jgi:Leucine-rich repeat (LRR) protein